MADYPDWVLAHKICVDGKENCNQMIAIEIRRGIINTVEKFILQTARIYSIATDINIWLAV